MQKQLKNTVILTAAFLGLTVLSGLGNTAQADSPYSYGSWGGYSYSTPARSTRNYGSSSLRSYSTTPSYGYRSRAENGDYWNRDNDGDGRRESVYVRGHYRNGTYVRGHYRAKPSR